MLLLALASWLWWPGGESQGETQVVDGGGDMDEIYDPMGGEEADGLPGEEGLGSEPSNEELERLADSDVALAERKGKFYRVFETAKVPYTGKVVEYRSDSLDGPDGQIPSSEKVYNAGVLTRHTEWHANGQEKMEAVLHANGVLKTTRFDEEGNPVRSPVRIGAAPGRGVAWKTGAGLDSIDIVYRGKGVGIIKKAFGEPDENQNGVWIYKGMNVTAVQTGQIMTTVRFTISNDQVLSVSVEP